MDAKMFSLKARLLKSKYAPFYEEFKKSHDDRIIVCNCLDKLVESCKAMEKVDDLFIKVAFSDALAEEEKTMEKIVTRFTGKVWVPFSGWKDGDVKA